MNSKVQITRSHRYYTRPNLTGNLMVLVDGLHNRIIAVDEATGNPAACQPSMTEVDMEWINPLPTPRMARVLKRLNARDFARRRQYGEPRAAYTARTGRQPID